MSDFVCYEIMCDGDKKPALVVGRTEADIVTSTIEWSGRIISMKFVSDNVFISREAEEYDLGVKWNKETRRYEEYHEG